jgi:hypothetical protein
MKEVPGVDAVVEGDAKAVVEDVRNDPSKLEADVAADLPAVTESAKHEVPEVIEDAKADILKVEAATARKRVSLEVAVRADMTQVAHDVRKEQAAMHDMPTFAGLPSVEESLLANDGQCTYMRLFVVCVLVWFCV